VRRTIYTTPVIRQIFWLISWIGIKLTGWKMVGTPPSEKKFVLVAVPHTSNWDFPITLAMAFLFGFRLRWMGKHTLFKGPMGPIMRWLGGVPVVRSQKNNLVDQVVSSLKDMDECAFAIPPEGTRSKADRWKTGFYYIAQGAEVPIGLAFLDYTKKVGGFGPTFYLTGDIDKDIADMQEFYKGIHGKNIDQCANTIEGEEQPDYDSLPAADTTPAAAKALHANAEALNETMSKAQAKAQESMSKAQAAAQESMTKAQAKAQAGAEQAADAVQTAIKATVPEKKTS